MGVCCHCGKKEVLFTLERGFITCIVPVSEYEGYENEDEKSRIIKMLRQKNKITLSKSNLIKTILR